MYNRQASSIILCPLEENDFADSDKANNKRARRQFLKDRKMAGDIAYSDNGSTVFHTAGVHKQDLFIG